MAMLSIFHDTLNSLGAFPISEVVRIGDEAPNKNGVLIRKVYLRDGKSFDTFATENGGLLCQPIQLIPALPNTTAVRTDVWGSEEDWVGREPVIAWALCLDGEIRAVTANGVAASGEGTFVEMPDGSVQGVGEWTEPCAYESVDAMISDRILHKRSVEARRAAAAEQEAPTHQAPDAPL